MKRNTEYLVRLQILCAYVLVFVFAQQPFMGEMRSTHNFLRGDISRNVFRCCIRRCKVVAADTHESLPRLVSDLNRSDPTWLL